MFSRSSVGEIGVNIRENTETSILIKRTFSFLYYCFNISKVACAAEPLIRTSSPLASRLIAYSSNAADFTLLLYCRHCLQPNPLPLGCCYHIIFINLVFQLTNAAKLHSYELKTKYNNLIFIYFCSKRSAAYFCFKKYRYRTQKFY